jgi:hypothetical protein
LFSFHDGQSFFLMVRSPARQNKTPASSGPVEKAQLLWKNYFFSLRAYVASRCRLRFLCDRRRRFPICGFDNYPEWGAVGLTSGGAYLVASSFLSADASDVMPQGMHSRNP